MKRISLLCALLACATHVSAADLSSTATLVVREIRVENNTLIPQSVLDATLPLYSNRAVSAAELQALAQRLTAYLVEAGYVSSGVIVPDQKIDDGVIRLRVEPGRIASAVVENDGRLRDSYVVRRLGDVYDAPLNVETLAERLRLLQQDPRIAKIDASVKPGIERGVAVLHLAIDEETPYGFSVGADNHLSPNVGEQQLSAEFHHLNLLGFGDALQLMYSNAEGFNGGLALYSLPFASGATVASLAFEHNSSTIVSEPFAVLDIEGETTRIGAELRHTFLKTLNNELTLGVGLETQTVESYLLGEPFSFSAETETGVSKATVVSFIQEWVGRRPARVIAVRSTFSAGVDALDASIGGPADGEFLYWLGQAQWLQKLNLWESALGVQMQVRVANDALPAYRKYTVGGSESVRGYRENLIVRDNGALASIEWTTPVAHWSLPGLSRSPSDGELSVTPFADFGYGRDYDDDQSEAIDVASVGVALRWRIARNSVIELEFAKALIDQEPASFDEVLQDEGVHFSARIGW